MTLRKRTNLARKLHPTLCLSKVGKSVWGMRTISDQSKNVQVTIRKSKHITSVNGAGKVSHGLYICEVQRVISPGVQTYFGPHLLEYAIASIMAEAKRNKKKIVFYSSLKSVALKRKIHNVSMIEIKAGKETIWGVIYND